MKLSDQELLKRVLYDGRHEDANSQLDQAAASRETALQLREDALEVEKMRKARTRRFWQWSVPVALVVLLLGGAVAYDYFGSWGTIHRNVQIIGLDVGGKTKEEAKLYLEENLDGFVQTPVVVRYERDPEDDDLEEADDAEDISWEILASDIGLSFDTTEAVEHAFAFGRAHSIFESLQERFLSYFEPQHIDVKSDADDERATETFAMIRAVANVEPSDSHVGFDAGQFVMKSGSDGLALDERQLTVLMADAVLARHFEIVAPIDVSPRDIDDENAARAAATANAARSGPVEVTYNDSHWTFEPSAIGDLISFSRSDELDEDDTIIYSDEPTPTAEVVLETIIPLKRVQDQVVSRLGADVGKAPVNARFSVSNGEVVIHPSETGSGVDAQQLAHDFAFAAMQADAAARRVEVSLNEIRPSRTTEDAQAMGIRERVATYTTNFSAGNAPRVNNIQLIARILDGTIIAPGEEFSFNGVTGQRTAARGFQEAGAIIRGEMSTAVGGGICQVSTTLFNATMMAGLNITQRINHSTFLSAYPPGRDATVAWGGPDFRFINSHDNYIMISTASSNSSVTISFFGIDPGYTVDIRTGEFRRNNFNTREIRDNTLPYGRRVVETSGQRGGTVNVVYTVRKGDSVVREQTFTSRYRTVDEVIRIGTKRDQAPAAEAPAASPEAPAND
ncbi:MAG: VanW family protein [Coriobacteriia bacterium]|nr:VanW family protein [Coriobacteriia bacterium]MCL2536988.1 VanW family protein [Coriobacteriia bacterium]